jgi:hypothetical protein
VTRSTCVLACALLGPSLAGAAPSPAGKAAASSPMQSVALWVDRVSSAQTIAAGASQAGVRTVFVKAADGVSAEPQFTGTLLAELQALGMSVCAWTFVYGSEPAGEAAVALAAVHDGAQCLVVDAEESYDGRYGAAQSFVRALRSALGASFPIGLAGQAEVLEHPTFPYSVFLGPGGFTFDMPQVYWRELGSSVGAVLRAAIPVNEIYGRPLLPVGQLFGAPSLTEVAEFLRLTGEYGAKGVSFFDLDAAEPAPLAALVPGLAHVRARALAPPTIRPGADGDEIVWAQELLNAAGARLPVGGFFGAQTARAVARFQAAHRLRRTGLLDAATWRALLRLHAREPSWAAAPPDSASA